MEERSQPAPPACSGNLRYLPKIPIGSDNFFPGLDIYRVANVWQKWPEFAKHWQIHPPRDFQVLPTLGKIGGNLPSIGKTVFSANRAFPARLPLPLVAAGRAVHAAASRGFGVLKNNCRFRLAFLGDA